VERRARAQRLRTHARDRRAAHRYATVLVLVLGSFLFVAFAPDNRSMRGILLLLESATLLAALWTSVSAPLRARLLIPLVAAGVAVAQLETEGRTLTAVAIALDGLFVVATIVVIARGVINDGKVSVQSVLGAICVYLLMGMLFTFLYSLAAVLGSGTLFAQGTDGTPAIRLYFSFVTLTTVGYGDYAPLGDIARTLANMEALFGQLYLVTVIGVLVSRVPALRRAEV
jgi:voltage-gated potassium channel